MNLTDSDIDRLLKQWAASSDMGISEEEYTALYAHASQFKHRHLAVILRAKKHDGLREHIMRDEILARALLKNPLEGRLVISALLLGAASSVATIGSCVRNLTHERDVAISATSPTTIVLPQHAEFKIGDYLMPKGSSVVSDIVKIVGVEEKNYKVFTHFLSNGRLIAAQDYQLLPRSKIEGDYVVVEAPKADGAFSPDKFLSKP